ncbi:dTDP-4-dehydrorhamnose 3,5-epimerase [Saccharolobus caldissimus]|uniref:dTDP-4-dehydrorhamnose 3,5-epimerase n=1 Tax=Saccharolobus caldissimus TaxID=1702097 RepID=A0AAQ4CUK2_9CREN|nr:dTDP-4-dehydrorhamnose 3,5-epimerase [Saccharolobus caldissimus]BDB99483.1 dTDP-4-dehydrorhamnose 3,5-epimerase [Saccharolobus caldissimus]
MPFEFEELGLGVLLIKPKVFPDNRGYFKEIFKESDFKKMRIPIPLQVNVSFSKPGVVRGLHYQLPPKEQGKVVTVIKGRILDVAVDIRKSSESFGKYVYAELSENNHYMLWIPPGFAHGFQALEESTIVYFITHNEYSPFHERCINYSIINWPIKNIVVSEKDAKCPPLNKAEVFE